MSSGRRELLAWLDRSALADKALAGRLDISRAYLSQILSGKRRPGLDVLAQIYDVTGIPPRAWLDRTEDDVDTYRDRRRHERGEVPSVQQLAPR